METNSQKTNTLIIYYFRLLGLYVCFFIALTLLSKYIPELLSDRYEQNALKKLLSEKPVQLFVLAVIFAPIIEEMMFRTLIKPSHSDIVLLICSWPLFYITHLIPRDVNWILKLLFIAIFLFTVFYILKELIPVHKTAKIRLFLNKNYKLALVLSALIFGLVHINNYVEEFVLNIALLTLIIPRILSGYMMGLIKIKNNHIGWSMGLHALNNGVVITFLILVKHLS